MHLILKILRGNTYIGFEDPRADEINEISVKILGTGNENILYNNSEYLNILYTNADGLLNKSVSKNPASIQLLSKQNATNES